MNETYKQINERFDERSRQLRKFGFRYYRIEELDIAVFTLKKFHKTMTIQTATLSHASPEVWADELARAERFASL